jgi:hypothetical protein
VRRIDLALLGTVRGDAAYGTAFVARAFGVTPEAVQGWCRAGKLESQRCPFGGHLLSGRSRPVRDADLLDDGGTWAPGPRWCDVVADLVALGLAGLAVAVVLHAAFAVWG